VLQGQDGWLFLGADVSGACEPLLPLDETLAGLDRFGELVRAAGKTYVFTVAPDKSTMNPDKLPESYVGDDCAPEAKALLGAHGGDPPLGYVDLKQELERVQEEDGENLWRPSDTHWAQRGALVYAQELAEALDPALWRTSRIERRARCSCRPTSPPSSGTPRTTRCRLAARARGRHRHRGARDDAGRHDDRRAAAHAADAHPRRLVHAELAVAAEREHGGGRRSGTSSRPRSTTSPRATATAMLGRLPNR
jgi:hypothetical protein